MTRGTGDTGRATSTAHTGAPSAHTTADTGSRATGDTSRSTADTGPARSTADTSARTDVDTSPAIADTGPECPEPESISTAWFAEFDSRGPAALDRLPDGRVLTTTHGDNGLITHVGVAKVRMFATATPSVTHRLGTNYNSPIEGRILGQSSAALGDTDGDGQEDVVASVFGEAPLYGPVLEHAAVFLGPFQPGDSQSVPPDATVLDDVAWRFARCDVNGDALADICSTRGIALAPPPFSTSSTFADGDPADRVAAATVDGVDGLVFARHPANALHFVPFTALPPAGQTSAALATHTAALTDRVLALGVADLHPDPGPELVAAVENQGSLGLVAWGLEPGFPERARFTSCHPAAEHGALALADFDQDGQMDAAFAAEGRLAVLRGPLTAGATATWWTAEHTWTDPEFPFGYSLLAWDDGDLLVGWPGYLRPTGIPPNGGYPAPDAYGGVLYRLTDPLALAP